MKNLALILFLLLQTHSLFAQSDTNINYKYPRILVHYAQEFYTDDGSFSNSSGNGFNYGVHVITPISNRFFMRTGFNYSYRKLKFKDNVFESNYVTTGNVNGFQVFSSDEYELYFLRIPTLLQYNILQKSKIKMHATAGITTNIRIKEVLTGTFPDGTQYSFEPQDAKRYIKPFVNEPHFLYKPFYISIGCGASYSIGRNFLLGVDVELDMNNGYNVTLNAIDFAFSNIINTRASLTYNFK